MLRPGSRGARRVVAVAVAAVAAMATFTVAAWGSTLPDGRGYEVVSPLDKNGGDVISDSQRTRAATDGDAVGFIALTGFANVPGTGVGTDYISVRSSQSTPGTNGWSTHGITAMQTSSLPLLAILANLESLYDGEFSDDLSRGVMLSYSPLTAVPSLQDVVNLYRRTDLRTPGSGSYDLLTACPLCDSTSTALSPLPINGTADRLRPYFAWASPDFGHVIFESRYNLTSTAPPPPAGCDLEFSPNQCPPRLYEWDHGVVRLAGILPDGTPADGSIAGQGAGSSHVRMRVPHTLSDGSDGHSRIFFTQPAAVSESFSGNVFMRLDGASTEQINLSERRAADGFAEAMFLDATPDGRRAFFSTRQALTDDAPADGQIKLYMYDATKPGDAPDNLRFMTPDTIEPANVQSTIGVSDDGSYVYFIANGQLVADKRLLAGAPGIYLWHDGELTFIGSLPVGTVPRELFSATFITDARQTRVTPDGRHLLFTAVDGRGLTEYDHGICDAGSGEGCRELYLYSADSDELVCASCNPSGAPATASATSNVTMNNGATQNSSHENQSLTDDGSRVFFSTAEPLVAHDRNGRIDAYQYNAPDGSLHLISSGTDPTDSWFLDASANGRDVFFSTSERLVGWDRDSVYDLYDARVGGGFPEPATPPRCAGDACQGVPGGAPAKADTPSAALDGNGNVAGKVKPRIKKCKRGFIKKRVRGKRRCVKRRHRAATQTMPANRSRRGS